MTSSPDSRHLEPDGLLEYLRSGAPALVPIEGSPLLTLVIEPDVPRIAVRAPFDGADLPDLRLYRHLSATAGTSAGQDWVEFGVTGEADLVDAYPVLCSVSDRVQLNGMTFGDAVRDVLQAYHEILSALGRLTDEQELGLVGELLVLDHLIGTVGERRAVAAWRGPLSEEHDFGLEDIDIEVKTTLAEQRAHRISSLTQLSPNPGRPLWLVSVQVSLGGVAALTLSQRVRSVADRLTSRELRQLFMATVEDIGWTEEQSDLYTRRFTTRGQVATYDIDSEFPAVTPRHLIAGGVPLDRVRSLSYILVLEGLAPDAPPDPLHGIGNPA